MLRVFEVVVLREAELVVLLGELLRLTVPEVDPVSLFVVEVVPDADFVLMRVSVEPELLTRLLTVVCEARLDEPDDVVLALFAEPVAVLAVLVLPEAALRLTAVSLVVPDALLVVLVPLGVETFLVAVLPLVPVVLFAAVLDALLLVPAPVLEAELVVAAFLTLLPDVVVWVAVEALRVGVAVVAAVLRVLLVAGAIVFVTLEACWRSRMSLALTTRVLLTAGTFALRRENSSSGCCLP